MTRTGESLEAAGFEVRVPSLSRRKPKPGLRLFVEPSGDTMVGARQLSNVRWSAVFDDVELTAEEVDAARRRGAAARAVARPLGRARPRRPEGGGGRARRAGDRRRSSPAPRSCATPSGSKGRRSASGSLVEGEGWAADLLDKADVRVARGGHRAGGLRRQAAHLPGRGARVAGLPRCRRSRRLPRPRHGPRQDADRARPSGQHRTAPALRSSSRRPPSSGNWAAEAARFTPEPASRHPPRRVARRPPTSSPPKSPTPTSSSPPTAPRSATSTRLPSCRGSG